MAIAEKRTEAEARETRISREGETADAKDQVLKSKARYKKRSQITRKATGLPRG